MLMIVVSMVEVGGSREEIAAVVGDGVVVWDGLEKRPERMVLVFGGEVENSAWKIFVGG